MTGPVEMVSDFSIPEKSWMGREKKVVIGDYRLVGE